MGRDQSTSAFGGWPDRPERDTSMRLETYFGKYAE
jgi:hypothetical protein